jgi:hypothetical protein
MRALILAGLIAGAVCHGAPTSAQVKALTVGVHSTCPYGIVA